jgi:hypothetical protein
MKCYFGRCLIGAFALGKALSPATAHTADPTPADLAEAAGGIEIFTSTDSDDTDVLKILGRALWKNDGRDKFQGIAIEQAWFTPQGQETRRHQRVYLDVADDFRGQWFGRARLGTDGHTWLGSANVRSANWHQEFFLEREIVETPQGLDQDIYYTLIGASLDLYASERDVLNGMAGVQAFSGKNERIHLRGSYVHALNSRLGLSVQLRGRYFHSTRPGEFDYFSPKNYVQLLPVIQMRRFDRAGWMYLVAAGLGAQRATRDSWQAARLVDVRIESPRDARRVQAFAQLQYSNNSLTGSGDYRYLMGRLGLTLGF